MKPLGLGFNSVLLGERVHGGRAEAGPASRVLGGEEGLEDVLEVILRDPAPGVADLEDHEIVRSRGLGARMFGTRVAGTRSVISIASDPRLVNR